MVQMWVLPETAGESAGYKVYRPRWGETTRVYGGAGESPETFGSRTTLEVALLKAGQTTSRAGPFLAYLTQGEGTANGAAVEDGDLFRGTELTFEASQDAQLLIVGTLD